MQATCSPSCCSSHSRAAAWSSRRGALTVLRFQPSNKQAVSPQQQQQPASSTEANKPADRVGIPAPQELAASVMLVPKKAAQAELMQQASATGSPLNSFLVKCRLAWNLFFPPGETSAATRQLSPKELGKQRLSMILVADRCGLSTHSLVEMKRSTLAALQDCMDLEDLQDAHLRFTMTRENGVTYSMAVPILRPDADEELEEGEDGFDEEGAPGGAAAAAWDPSASWEEEGEWAGEDSGVEGAGLSLDELPCVDGLVAPGELVAAELSTDSLPAVATTAAAAAAAKPASWAAAGAEAGGAVPASRAASRAASRGRGASSPAELQQPAGQQGAVMTPDMLKELLVEELVHDVEELVEHMGPQAVVQAWETSPEPTAAAGAGVLVEQLEAAVAEVQHFGEVAGSTSGSSSETVAESGIQGPEAAAGR